MSTHLYAFLRNKAGSRQGSLEACLLQGGEQSEALLRRTEPVESPKGDSVEDRAVMGACSSFPSAQASTRSLAAILSRMPHP